MAVYTTLLASGVTTIGDITTDVYTAPASGVLVVRDIVLTPLSNALPLVGVEVRSPGGELVILTMTPDSTRLLTNHWQGRQVIEPGSTLVIYCSDGAAHYHITGYLLGA